MKVRIVCGIGMEEFKSRLLADLKTFSECSLSLVFVNRIYNADSVCEPIREIFAQFNVRFVAMSSNGEICNGEIFHRTITAILFNYSEDSFHVIAAETAEKSSYKTGISFGKKARDFFTNPSVLVFGTGNSFLIGDDLVSGIKDSLPGNSGIYGGLASQDLSLKATWLFTKNFYTESGLAAVVFDSDKINMRGIAVNGWRELGLPKEVTLSDGNTVFEIDGIPVLDFYDRYFRTKDESQQALIRLVSGYPLILLKPDGSRTVRSIIRVDFENNGVVYGGLVPQGSKVMFSMPEFSEIVDSVLKDFSGFYRESPTGAYAMLMLSCVTRPLSLGDQLPLETRGIQSIWNVPSAGFFTYGEIGSAARCSTDFHNNTVSIVVFSENSADDDEIEVEDEIKKAVVNNPVMERIITEKLILTNFIRRTSEDLTKALEELEKVKARSGKNQ